MPEPQLSFVSLGLNPPHDENVVLISLLAVVRYVLHCEMPVANTDLTHADVGMVRQIETKD